MYTVFLAGGIASGKSTVASELARLGARRIDLDALSRAVLEPSSPCTKEVAAAFGEDLLDAASGELDRSLLAKRAFADEASGKRLEAIELPYIRDALVASLAELKEQGVGGGADDGRPICIVEVPLLDRMESMLDLADEVLVVICPLELRRKRAQARGMDAADFDRRVALQPTDDYLRAHATTVIENDGTREELLASVRAWWDARVA